MADADNVGAANQAGVKATAPSPTRLDFAAIRKYPFFTACDDTLLKDFIQPFVAEARFERGDKILRAGGYADAAYYIAEGFVQLRVAPLSNRASPLAGNASVARRKSLLERLDMSSAAGGFLQQGIAEDGTLVLSDVPENLTNGEAIIGPGECFGEMSALNRYPLAADAIASTAVTCLLIRQQALRAMFAARQVGKYPELAAFKKRLDDRYRERTLGNHLRSIELFRALDDAALDRIRHDAVFVSYGPGKQIVSEGSAADAFYLVRGGFVKVAVRAGAADAAVTYLRKGDHAGELCLLLDEPWPFSLDALENVELVKVPRELFQQAAENSNVRSELWRDIVPRLKERGRVARSPLTSRYLQFAMDSGLIHGESVLLIDLSTCTRCDDCVRACADTHEGIPRFTREGLKFQKWSVPYSCYQCTDPVCMIGCPTGAITRPLGTLEVTIDKETCIGCEFCTNKCPWQNIVSVPRSAADGVAVATLGRRPPEKGSLKTRGLDENGISFDYSTKCDLCIGRSEGPACVQMCPHGSAVRISFKDTTLVTKTLSAS